MKQCKNCGAYLDPEELCDCKKQGEKKPPDPAKSGDEPKEHTKQHKYIIAQEGEKVKASFGEPHVKRTNSSFWKLLNVNRMKLDIISIIYVFDCGKIKLQWISFRKTHII